VSGVLNKFGR
jgi:hypothetical protein